MENVQYRLSGSGSVLKKIMDLNPVFVLRGSDPVNFRLDPKPCIGGMLIAQS